MAKLGIIIGGLVAAGIGAYVLVEHSASATTTDATAGSTGDTGTGSAGDTGTGSTGDTGAGSTGTTGSGSTGTAKPEPSMDPTTWSAARIKHDQKQLNALLSGKGFKLIVVDGAIGKHTCGAAAWADKEFGGKVPDDILALVEHHICDDRTAPTPAEGGNSTATSAAHAAQLEQYATDFVHSVMGFAPTKKELCSSIVIAEAALRGSNLTDTTIPADVVTYYNTACVRHGDTTVTHQS